MNNFFRCVSPTLKSSVYKKHFSTSSVYYYCPKINWAKVMGKEDKRQLFNQEIRIVKRNRASKESPSMVYFQILGNGALGGPKSVFIFTDHNRYLFNCGEGTQKIYTEHTSHKSLGQLANIFITRKCWDNMGGLTGKKSRIAKI